MHLAEFKRIDIGDSDNPDLVWVDDLWATRAPTVVRTKRSGLDADGNPQYWETITDLGDPYGLVARHPVFQSIDANGRAIPGVLPILSEYIDQWMNGYVKQYGQPLNRPWYWDKDTRTAANSILAPYLTALFAYAQATGTNPVPEATSADNMPNSAFALSLPAEHRGSSGMFSTAISGVQDLMVHVVLPAIAAYSLAAGAGGVMEWLQAGSPLASGASAGLPSELGEVTSANFGADAGAGSLVSSGGGAVAADVSGQVVSDGASGAADFNDINITAPPDVQVTPYVDNSVLPSQITSLSPSDVVKQIAENLGQKPSATNAPAPNPANTATGAPASSVTSSLPSVGQVASTLSAGATIATTAQKIWNVISGKSATPGTLTPAQQAALLNAQQNAAARSNQQLLLLGLAGAGLFIFSKKRR